MHHFNFGQSLPGGRLPAQPAAASSYSASQPTQQQQQLRVRARHVAVSAAAAAAAGLGGYHLVRHGRQAQQQAALKLHQQQQQQQLKQPLFLIPRELAEVICGAFGEIVQVAVLYPLDTIKVRCQAGGLSVAAVMQQLLAAGSPRRVLGQLYAGVAGASLASVAVGSLYYFTFCAAKRTATKLVAEQQQQQQQAAIGTSASAAASAASTAARHHSGNSSSSSPVHHFPHGSGIDCHCHDPVFASICSEDAAAAASQSSLSSTVTHQTATAVTSNSTSSSSSSSSGSNAPELSSNGKLQANILAACAAALVGALVEAPVELFKHRAQAGQISGNMLAHVVQALRQQGPRALYGSFFLPFCFKSLPFDIAELMTYSSLQDFKESSLSKAAAAAAPGAAASAGGAAVAVTAPDAPVVPAAMAVAAAADAGHLQQQQQLMGVVPALGSITAAATAAAAGTGSSTAGGRISQQQFLADIPEHAWDMAIGAAAGAAAVLLSMPPDTVKTVMETGGGVVAAPGSGPLGSAAAFVGTGRQLVKARGPAGLFTGVTPRLVESVPSTMLYWLAVEGCRRLLEPYTAK